MDAEVEIYRHLAELQGKVIPEFYGYVDFNGLFRALVLEDCGEEISEADMENYKTELRSHLEQIHAAGILHGDVETRNILIKRQESDPSVQLRIIDFSHAKLVDKNDSALAKELAKLT